MLVNRCCCTPAGICQFCAMETFTPLSVSATFAGGYSITVTVPRFPGGPPFQWQSGLVTWTPSRPPTVLNQTAIVTCSATATSFSLVIQATTGNVSYTATITAAEVVSCSPLLIQWTGSRPGFPSNPAGNLTSATISS